jgi:hypothetical protein
LVGKFIEHFFASAATDVVLNPKKPTYNTEHIPVNYGNLLFESKGGNSCRGIGSYAF